MSEFTTNWYSDQNLAMLGDFADSKRLVPGSYFEVGSWEGRSALEICARINPEVLYCVDTWQGSIPDGYSVEDDSVYNRFISNMDNAGAKYVPLRMSWDEVNWEDYAPIKFIHIDAEHTYDAVAGNIRAVIPYMAIGGIICGDDFFHDPVANAVKDCLPGYARHSQAFWSYIVGNNPLRGSIGGILR